MSTDNAISTFRALDLALEVLKAVYVPADLDEQREKAITAIKQAKKSNIKQVIHLYDEPPAQPAPVQSAEERSSVERGEPVAWTNWRELAGAKHYQTPGWEMYADKRNPDDVALYTTPPGGRQSEDCLTAAQKDIQRLSALVRAQQITIDKLEQGEPVTERNVT